VDGEGRRGDPAGEGRAGVELEVVLAFDTSGSMLGVAMESAKSAAEAFVGALPPTTRIALVSFSSTPNVVVPMTTDRGALVGAIRGLRAQGETALYDAVVAAAGQFSASGAARRELVVLSDGGDTVSRADQVAAIRSLADAKVRGYVASLVTEESATAFLDELARSTGGRVVGATDPAAIRSVFGDIGAALTNQYRLTFPKRGRGQMSVTLAVSSAGVSASADRVIALPSAPARIGPAASASPYVVAPSDRRWMKVTGLALFAIGALALALFLFVPTRPRRVSSRWIAEHASKAHSDTSLQELTHRAADLAERSLQRRGWAGCLDISLERAGVPLRPGEFILAVIAASVGAWFVGTVLFGPLLGIVLAIATAFLARTFLRMKVNRRRSKFEGQLGETLQLLSGSLRAGYGLSQALDAVAKNAESPTAEEFNRLTMETRVGRSLPEALSAVAGRVGSEDFDWIVEAIAINREVGGDLTELLDRAATTIRERENVRRQVKALSAEGRLSAYVLGGIPVGLFLYMKVSNPEYIGELTSTGIGWAMLGVAVTMMTLGGLWLRKLVQVTF
jgi:tight adherence protein B